MEIISYLWQQYLYVPGFNLLVWVYINYSFFNLGVAIIIITVLLRILLLPFTILNEKGNQASQELAVMVAAIKKDYANDPVGQKIEIRKAFKTKKIRPWANAIVIAFQGVVLLLLYQIFISGINAQNNFQILYPGIPRPDFINTIFLGFHLDKRSIFLAAITAVYLFLELLFGSYIKKGGTTRREQIFIIFFPAFTFLALAILPSVKSIFILTSIIFSSIISVFILLIKLSFKKSKKA